MWQITNVLFKFTGTLNQVVIDSVKPPSARKSRKNSTSRRARTN